MSQLEGKTFHSREWVFAKLGQMLDSRSAVSSSQPGTSVAGILLVGGPGAGKTAFCSELVHPVGQGRQKSLSNRIVAHHFINVYQPDSFSVANFIVKTVQQLTSCRLISGYEDKLRHPELEECLKGTNVAKDPDEAFKKLVVFPLLEMDAPDQSCILIVDSLDEPAAVNAASDLTAPAIQTDSNADTDGSQSIVELLANNYHLLPPWLLLLLTMRRQNKAMARLFSGFKKIALDEVRRGSVIRDVQQYILGRLEKEAPLRRHLTRETAPALNLLHIKSHGCLLYVETVLDGVADGSVLLRDIPEIPGTLNGLYLWLCQRLFTRRNWTRVEPLLAILLASRRPPTRDQIHQATLTLDPTMTANEFRRRMEILRKLVVPAPGTPDTWMIFHSSFAEWLCDVKHCTQRFLVKVSDGHARWTVALANRGAQLNRCELDDLTYHLSRLNLQSPLEAWHLPLWLLWTKTPVPDQAALQVMVNSFGVQQDGADESDDSISPTGQDWTNETGAECVEPQVVSVETSGDVGQVSDGTAVPTENQPEGEHVERCEDHCDSQPASLLVDESSLHDPVPDDRSSLEPSASFGHGLERRDSYRFKSLNEIDDPEQTLFYAVQLGHVAAVRKLTGRYLSMLSSESLRHGLSMAARQGNAQLVSILLDAGVDPDAADSEGWTPLRAAAWGGHTATVQVLLDRGAQVDACDSEGRTALRAAAWAGHEQVVRSLLAAGAGVDGRDRQGRTPLIAAAYMGHADIVAALLDAGADPNHADCEGRTALSVAVLSVTCRTSSQCHSAAMSATRRRRATSTDTAGRIQRHKLAEMLAEDVETPLAQDVGTQDATLDEDFEEAVETIAILLEYGARVDHQDKEGMTPLLVAAFEGHRAACELLLEAEADVDQADLSGRTPLLAAASMGHARVVELLLFWGCYVDSIDAEGRTVLSVAAAQGSIEVVRRLLDRGLDEAHRDNAGWTPLHYAAFEGHAVVVDLLLEVGSRVDSTDNDGRTALLLASQEGHVKVVERLIQVGADVNQKSLDGKTPLRAAALDGHTDVVSVLLAADGIDVSYKDVDGRSTLYLLAIENKLAQVEIILKMGKGDLQNDRDLEGRTPLHVAAWQGHTAMVDLLLRYGADVNAVDREQRTPLQSAAWQGHESVVWLLLKNGARVDQPCSQGATPLSIAAQEGHESVAKLLLAAGADPNRADGCGRTALKLALKGGHKKMVQLLENWSVTCASSARNESISSKHSTISGTDQSSSLKPLVPGTSGLDPVSREYSPSSTFETGLRSNTSSGKSSSNLTSSTARSSQMSVVEPSPIPITQQSSPVLSFTQQLQQVGRGSRVRTGQLPNFQPRVLSPLSEPQSPLYSSPPPLSPQKEVEPIWQRPKDSAILHARRGDRNSSHDANGLANGNQSHQFIHFGLMHREKSQDSFTRPPVTNPTVDLPTAPQRTSSGDEDRLDSSLIINHSTPTKFASDFNQRLPFSNRNPASSTQSSHMQIILGPPSKSRRNGLGRQQSNSSGSSLGGSGGGGLSGMLAGIRNSAFLHGSSKLKNALCNAVSSAKPVINQSLKKETQL